jgi:hypothetical protein
MAARVLEAGLASSLEEAARGCGSNVPYTRAAATILKTRDNVLIETVVKNKLNILETAKQVKGLSVVLHAFRNLSAADRAAFGKNAGPAVVFDTVVVPAL